MPSSRRFQPGRSRINFIFLHQILVLLLSWYFIYSAYVQLCYFVWRLSLEIREQSTRMEVNEWVLAFCFLLPFAFAPVFLQCNHRTKSFFFSLVPIFLMKWMEILPSSRRRHYTWRQEYFLKRDLRRWKRLKFVFVRYSSKFHDFQSSASICIHR